MVEYSCEWLRGTCDCRFRGLQCLALRLSGNETTENNVSINSKNSAKLAKIFDCEISLYTCSSDGLCPVRGTCSRDLRLLPLSDSLLGVFMYIHACMCQVSNKESSPPN